MDKLTWILPAKEIEEEVVVVCIAVSFEPDVPKAKRTGQGRVVGSSIIWHFSGRSQIGELVAGGSSFLLDSLRSWSGLWSTPISPAFRTKRTHLQDLVLPDCSGQCSGQRQHLHVVIAGHRCSSFSSTR